jgi:AraC-like DNA-binding protein
MGYHLAAFTIIDTCRVDETRSILTDAFGARSFDVGGDRSLFSTRAGHFKFGATDLSYCAYGCPVSLEFHHDEFFRIQFCIAGAGRTSKSTGSVDVSPTTIVATTAKTAYAFGHSYEQLVLRADRLMLERELTALLGSRPKDPLSLDMATNCETGQARRLREIVLHTADSIDISSEPIPPPLLREMDQTIRLSILYGIPNNYSHRLYAGPQAMAPWQVRRVEEWIDVHWRQSVTLETLVEISGASLRTIFATFKTARGYTPMAYLKQVRLNAAREMLLKAEPGATVTAISFACNFLNSSHFARDYERQFGELPSETLRRGRTLRS